MHVPDLLAFTSYTGGEVGGFSPSVSLHSFYYYRLNLPLGASPPTMKLIGKFETSFTVVPLLAVVYAYMSGRRACPRHEHRSQ